MKKDLPITEKMKDKAQAVLSNHPKASFVYVTEDLNVFLPEGENDCQNHVIRKGNRVAIVHREKEDSGSGGSVAKIKPESGLAGVSSTGKKGHKQSPKGQQKVEMPVPEGKDGQGSTDTSGAQSPNKSEEGAGATESGSSPSSENTGADQNEQSNPGSEASDQDESSNQLENNASGETSEVPNISSPTPNAN